MPNIPASFQGGKGVPSIDTSTKGQVGIGSGRRVDQDYGSERTPTTTGKAWSEFGSKVSTGGKAVGQI